MSDTLVALFGASLSPDPNVRKQAELQLRRIERDPGFLSELLKLIATPPPNPNDAQREAARQAGAIYLKNRLQKSWGTADPASMVPLVDKDFIRSNIVSALVHSPSRLRSLLVPSLGVLVNHDYPSQWQNLVPQLVGLISSSETAAIETGLRGLIEVFRLIRWNRKEKRWNTEQIFGASMPPLLELTQKLATGPDASNLQPPPATAAEAATTSGYLLYLALKAYKTSIQSELSALQQETIVPWGQLFLAVVQKRLGGTPGLPEDETERAKWGWWKAKKWAYYILNRLHSRYGSPSQLPTQLAHYKPFAERFITFFAPEILKAYLHEIELYVQGQAWMSNKVLCHVLSFLEESVKPKETWALLKPHVDTLIARFVFPLICITESELAEFNEEPAVYVRTHFGEFVDDYLNTPSLSATAFVLALASGRKKATFVGMLGFINQVCSKASTEGSPMEKDGAIRMLGHLSSVITETKSLRRDIEQFFVAHVFPEFSSEHAFLRCRVCEVLTHFENFNNDWIDAANLETVYKGILKCIFDPCLPVRVQAALALPGIIEYDQVRSQLAPNIGQMMQELLKLSNEVDLDNLTQSIRVLVSNFSDELLPYAAELSVAYAQSYHRLVSEMLEARGSTEEEDDVGEEKALVAINLLRTLQQLVVGLEGNAATISKVECASIPIIQFTLQNELVELYDEIFELLDAIQFALKIISPQQWSLFDMMYDLFKGPAIDFLAEMFPALDNFVTYGSSEIAGDANRRHKVFDIYLTAMTSPKLGAGDRVTACKLADCALLGVRGGLDDGVALFIEHSMGIIRRNITTQDPVVTKGLLMHAIETVLCAIHYNPALAMGILTERGWTGDFFSGWFAQLGSMHRAHDKKLSILAISGILRVIPTYPPNSAVPQSSGQLVLGVLQLCEKYPAALQRRAEAEDEYSPDDEEDEVEDDGDESTGEDGDEDGDVRDPEQDYLEYVGSVTTHRSSSGASAASTSWSDEVLWETPLDTVDLYWDFAQSIEGLKSSAPHVLELVNQQLNDDQRNLLQSVLQQASMGGETAMKNSVKIHDLSDKA